MNMTPNEIIEVLKAKHEGKEIEFQSLWGWEDNTNVDFKDIALGIKNGYNFRVKSVPLPDKAEPEYMECKATGCESKNCPHKGKHLVNSSCTENCSKNGFKPCQPAMEVKPGIVFPQGFEFCEIFSDGVRDYFNYDGEAHLISELIEFRDRAGFGYLIDGEVKMHNEDVVYLAAQSDGSHSVYYWYAHGRETIYPRWVVFKAKGAV